jgi:hypothetical protein
VQGTSCPRTDSLARRAYLGVADKLDALAEEISQADAILTALNMAGARDVSLPSVLAPPGVEKA